MVWIVGIALLCGGLSSDLHAIKDWDQTHINDGLFNQGIIFEILQNSCGAIKSIESDKLYLKSERIFPSEEGLLLVGDDNSTLLLPKLYSDRRGCYLKSYVTCASCGFKLPKTWSCPDCLEESP